MGSQRNEEQGGTAILLFPMFELEIRKRALLRVRMSFLAIGGDTGSASALKTEWRVENSECNGGSILANHEFSA